MNNENHFYTLKGYSLLEKQEITASMEDYLEMICRMNENGSPVHINRLAQELHVRPSSASKMVTNLKARGLVDSPRYGTITLTEAGRQLGQYLLFRHEILHRFFCYLNDSENELEQVEKIEHFVTEKTIRNMKKFLDRPDH